MKTLPYIALLVFLDGCEEVITLSTSINGYLVVDGFLTDQVGKSRIRLNMSPGYSSNQPTEMIRDANVTVLEDWVISTFSDSHLNQGYYTSSDFVAIAGKSYQGIIIIDEASYISDPEQLATGLAFEISTSDRLISKLSGSNTPIQRSYSTFQTQLTEKGNVPHYLRCKWEGNYENDPGIQETSSVTTTQYVRIGEIPKTKEIGLRKNSFNIYMEYTHTFTQLYMTKTAYQFWDQVEKQNQNTGSTFDTNPSSTSGNVRQIGKTSSTILGYISVASSLSSSQKNIFN